MVKTNKHLDLNPRQIKINAFWYSEVAQSQRLRQCWPSLTFSLLFFLHRAEVQFRKHSTDSTGPGRADWAVGDRGWRHSTGPATRVLITVLLWSELQWRRKYMGQTLLDHLIFRFENLLLLNSYRNKVLKANSVIVLYVLGVSRSETSTP